jgi:hypothetical protein
VEECKYAIKEGDGEIKRLIPERGKRKEPEPLRTLPSLAPHAFLPSIMRSLAHPCSLLHTLAHFAITLVSPKATCGPRHGDDRLGSPLRTYPTYLVPVSFCHTSARLSKDAQGCARGRNKGAQGCARGRNKGAQGCARVRKGAQGCARGRWPSI